MSDVEEPKPAVTKLGSPVSASAEVMAKPEMAGFSEDYGFEFKVSAPAELTVKSEFDVFQAKRRKIMEDAYGGTYNAPAGPAKVKKSFHSDAPLASQGRTDELVDEETNVKKHSRDDTDESEEMPSKRLCVASAASNGQQKTAAWAMMEKMGYEKGKGLGAQAQGRAEPVALSTQRGRRGLGLTVKGFEPSEEVGWDPSKENLEVTETPIWIPQCSKDLPSSEVLDTWYHVGKKKLIIDDETHFCDPAVLKRMLDAKSVFDVLTDRELRNARTRANPFESIKGAFFQNRAAMKMANLDAVFDFMFTNPKTVDGQPLFDRNGEELFYFADVCAGPGGFTEYMIWKLNWRCHGFGFTLKGPDDFKLDKFLAASPEMFEPYYGVDGVDGDGDVTVPANLREFRRFVKDVTDNKGVQTFMADGGFSVEGNENIQEILSKRIYLCQFLCALSILRPGGNFVCKLFDIFTPFSVGLVYLMYRCFEQVCIHKPHTSRPANSERYIIGKRLRPGADVVHDYMFKLNELLDGFAKNESDDDLVEVVPLDVLRGDSEFYEYILESNERIGDRQVLYLEKYKAFAQNSTLTDMRQKDLRETCLAYWQIPDQKRPDSFRGGPGMALERLCPKNNAWIGSRSNALRIEELNKVFEYRGVIYTSEPCLILSLGGRNAYSWQAHYARWEPLQNDHLMLPRSCLFLGEIAKEFKGEGKGRISRNILRIFDAFFLNDENITTLPYTVRIKQVAKFCKAISKEKSLKSSVIPKPAETIKLVELEKFAQQLSLVKVQGADRVGVPCVDSDYLIAAKGMLIFKIIKEPWTIAWSRSNRRTYYFNQQTGVSAFEMPKNPELVVDFIETFKDRIVWEWKEADVVFAKTANQSSSAPSMSSVCEAVKQKLEAIGAL